jgi:hypothetical protein
MQHFIPSDEIPPLAILSEAFACVPPSVARAAIETYTQPGAVILDPFCAGVSVIQAAIDLDRKIIAASFNPIAILAIEATLWPIDPRMALTHLADARKGSDRLREHVLDLYRTRCPVCAKEAIALEFSWDRELRQPIQKRVRCETCGENSAAVDADDQTNVKRLEPRGLPFWLLHGRVIDRSHEEADRVSEVLDAYTPRAQAAIGDIVLKFEGLSELDRTALRPALVATLDACTSLHTLEETARRISGLKPPAQFVEKNIWLELESFCSAFSLRSSIAPVLIPRQTSVTALLESSSASAFLIADPTREVTKLIPAQSIELILSHPPLPRPGFWSLSTCWTAWLWNKQKIEAMLPLLSRRRTSWDWQWRAISSALHAIDPVLNETAHCTFAFANAESVMESVTLASAGANHTIDHVVCDPHDGTRATWTPHHPTPADRDLESLAIDIRSIVRDAAVRILRDRAEPTDRLVVQAGIYAALGQRDASAIIAHLPEGDQSPLAFMRDVVQSTLAANDSPMVALDEHMRWLKEDVRSGTSISFHRAFNSETKPLADRVEAAVIDLLRSQTEWPGDELLREVYRRFPDQLTPDRALVATCIGSYADEIKPRCVQLRTEDVLQAREIEVKEVRQSLEFIGKKLNFEVKSKSSGVIWLQNKQEVYSFLISTLAEIDPMLRAESGVLVLPGGRASLLQFKLNRDPRLHESQWQTLKFSSLRHLAERTDLTLDVFALALGLEPPIEQKGTQIKLL